MIDGVTVRALTGAELEAALEGVASLRIAVFRDWPYLYDGSLEYERAYLQTYRDSPGALLVGAFHGDRLVGASTSTPMEDHAEAFAGPLRQIGLPVESILYGAESVLLPAFRGQGAGHVLIAARERHARRLGLRWAVLATYDRAEARPERPADWRPLDPFWRARGYRPLMGVGVTVPWVEAGRAGAQGHTLDLWVRDLTAP